MTSQVLDPLGTNYTRLVVNRRAPCGALPNSNFPWIAAVSRLPRLGGGRRLWVSRNPLLWVSRNPQQAQIERVHFARTFKLNAFTLRDRWPFTANTRSIICFFGVLFWLPSISPCASLMYFFNCGRFILCFFDVIFWLCHISPVFL